ncbi:hypothetical protein ONN26_24940, partial [Salmonella enterica subsp. enterica serovar Muenster]|nr:hypothetical protein [Salmonella enterica subsp. enterica serovar Muenster]
MTRLKKPGVTGCITQFSGSEGWWRVFDFTVLNGSFGHVTGTQTFRGAGGTGAKDGFL